MNESQFALQADGKRPFRFWRCFWLSFLAISLGYAWHCFYVPSNDIAWAKNFEVAQMQSAESGKPMILYFTSQWCVPCRIMKREVWADNEVRAAIDAQFIPVAIDVSDSHNAALLARYKVEGAPVSIITDQRGHALDWRAGKIGKSSFLEFLQSANPQAALEF